MPITVVRMSASRRAMPPGIVLGVAGALLLLCASVPARAAVRGEPVQLAAVPQPLPDGKSFVFVWSGDLWKASIRGGKAKPLTRHAAEDHWPCISADGRQLAFSSKRADAWQVYVMPIEGGAPRQITFHSEGATPLAWFPDGRSILVRASRDEPGVKGHRFLRVASDGSGVETLLFDAYVGDADISPDGTKILFTREGEDLYRKGYRGSNASQLWLYEIPSARFQRVRNDPGGDRSPLWRPDGKGFYYVGQESGCQNIWEQDLPSGKPKQLTHFTDAPVIVPRIAHDGSVITFRHLFDFYRFDPRSKAEPQKIRLSAVTDVPREHVRRRWYTNIWNNDSDGTLDWTADGLQMCFTAGGDLWVMDTVLREPVQVTRESGIHETEAAFAPDGKSIYVLRDTGDRVNVWQVERAEADQPWWRNQKFKLTQLTRDDSGKYNLSVSPNGSNIAYCAARGDIYVADAKGRNPVRVLTSQMEASYDWAPDGKWLCCDVSDDFENRDVWIVSTTGAREPYNVSRHPNWDGASRWSPDGRRLAFVGRRYDDTTDIYYVNLRREDEDITKRDRIIEDAMAKMKNVPKGAGNDGAKPPVESAAADVAIDFTDLCERIHRVDMKGGVPANPFWSYDSKALAFSAVIDGRGGTYKIVFPDNLRPEFMTERRGTQGHWIQRDSTILWMVDRVPAHFNTSFGFTALQETVISDYRRLGFRMIWRTMRDRFYDGRLNNLDWPAILARYEDAAANAPDGVTFQKTALMLLGELNASHMDFTLSDSAKKEWGDDWKSRNWAIRTGHTGLLFDRTFQGPGLKVQRVLTNGPTDRDATRVRAGESVLEINGTAVSNAMNWTRLLTGGFPRDDRLLVADLRGSNRLVTVRTISYDEARELAREDEVELTRKRVEEGSKGRLGYLHVAKMQWEDLRRFEQEVYARGFDKDGLIIDVRGNSGGFTADRLLAILCQPMHSTTVIRGGGQSYPSGYLGKVVWTKPLTVLCDQDTASNGEIFCHAIKTLHRGAIVGVPTQGSVISTAETDILDLGTLRVPHRGWFVGPTGQDMELNGCVPDHVVEKTPADEASGADPQLVKAVDVLLKAVAEEAKKPAPKLTPASELRESKAKRS
jgi:tricorn protease